MIRLKKDEDKVNTERQYWNSLLQSLQNQNCAKLFE